VDGWMGGWVDGWVVDAMDVMDEKKGWMDG
jgi:hypothetical protein